MRQETNIGMLGKGMGYNSDVNEGIKQKKKKRVGHGLRIVPPMAAPPIIEPPYPPPRSYSLRARPWGRSVPLASSPIRVPPPAPRPPRSYASDSMVWYDADSDQLVFDSFSNTRSASWATSMPAGIGQSRMDEANLMGMRPRPFPSPSSSPADRFHDSQNCAVSILASMDQMSPTENLKRFKEHRQRREEAMHAESVTSLDCLDCYSNCATPSPPPTPPVSLGMSEPSNEMQIDMRSTMSIDVPSSPPPAPPCPTTYGSFLITSSNDMFDISDTDNSSLFFGSGRSV